MRIVWRALPSLALPVALGLGAAYLATGFLPRPAPELRPPEELRAKGQAFGDESPMRTVLEKNVLGLEANMFEPLGLPPLEVPALPEAPAPAPAAKAPQAAYAPVNPALSAPPPPIPAAAPAPAEAAPAASSAAPAPAAASKVPNGQGPQAPAHAPAPSGAQSASHAPAGLDGVRLVGVIAGGERTLALFSVEGATVTLRPGEVLRGWTLEAVTAQEAVLRQGQAQRRLQLGAAAKRAP